MARITCAGGRLPRAGRRRTRLNGGPLMARSTAIHVSPPPVGTHAGVSLSAHGGRPPANPARTPTRQSFSTARRSTRRCSHFGSPLRPGKPVLALGVSRRHRTSGLCSCRRLTERGAYTVNQVTRPHIPAARPDRGTQPEGGPPPYAEAGHPAGTGDV